MSKGTVMKLAFLVTGVIMLVVAFTEGTSARGSMGSAALYCIAASVLAVAAAIAAVAEKVGKDR
jgi:hypothetical protein